MNGTAHLLGGMVLPEEGLLGPPEAQHLAKKLQRLGWFKPVKRQVTVIARL
jgi:hypothetical protein